MTKQQAFRKAAEFHFALLDDALNGQDLIDLVDKWVDEEPEGDENLLVWEPFEDYPREDVREFIWNLADTFREIYEQGKKSTTSNQ